MEFKVGENTYAWEVIPDNGKVVKPIDPTLSYGTFDAWYKDNAFMTKYDFKKDTITKKTLLYAGWDYTKYNVSFETGDGSAVGSKTVIWTGKVLNGEISTRDGYRFDGWMYKGKAVDANTKYSELVSGDNTVMSITLTAKRTDITAPDAEITFGPNIIIFLQPH